MRYRRSGQRTIRELIAARDDGRTDFRFEESWMLKFAQAGLIKFLGVFNTVGALGVPLPRLHPTAYPFLNIGLRQNNEYAFHPLAIDEHREAFAPTLWINEGYACDTAPDREHGAELVRRRPRQCRRRRLRRSAGAASRSNGSSARPRRSASPSRTVLRSNPKPTARQFRTPTASWDLYRLATFCRPYYRRSASRRQTKARRQQHQ